MKSYTFISDTTLLKNKLCVFIIILLFQICQLYNVNYLVFFEQKKKTTPRIFVFMFFYNLFYILLFYTKFV